MSDLALIAVHSVVLFDGFEIIGHDDNGEPLKRARSREVKPGETFQIEASEVRELIRAGAAILASDTRRVAEMRERDAALAGRPLRDDE